MPKIRNYSKKRLQTAIDAYFEDTASVKSLAGLALHLGVDKMLLEQWFAQEQSNRQTCGALHLAKTRIEKEIIENGLRGKYNATMASFLLKAAFGYRDKPDEARGADEPLRVEVSDELSRFAV